MRGVLGWRQKLFLLDQTGKTSQCCSAVPASRARREKPAPTFGMICFYTLAFSFYQTLVTQHAGELAHACCTATSMCK